MTPAYFPQNVGSHLVRWTPKCRERVLKFDVGSFGLASSVLTKGGIRDPCLRIYGSNCANIYREALITELRVWTGGWHRPVNYVTGY